MGNYYELDWYILPKIEKNMELNCTENNFKKEAWKIRINPSMRCSK